MSPLSIHPRSPRPGVFASLREVRPVATSPRLLAGSVVGRAKPSYRVRTLDEVDVKLFFDMYRALQPREAPDRRTIVAALQASFG